MDHSVEWTTGEPSKQGTSPHPPHTKSTAPRQGAQCFCFICLEKLGPDIPHLEGADDAAVLALGDT